MAEIILKVDQIHLMAAIVREIGRQHGGQLTADEGLMNSVINTANFCKKQLDGKKITTVTNA